MPLTFITYDECLRVRIGLEHLDSFSYGSGYGGTGALRLRQVHGAGDSALWFFAYRLDDDGHRGTAPLQPGDLDLIRLYLPSATLNGTQAGGLRISEQDLHALFEALEADPLETDQINRQRWALEHPPVETTPSRRSFIDDICNSLKRSDEDDQRLRFALDHLSTDALRGLSERCFTMFVDSTVHIEWLLAEARKLEDGTVHPWWPRLLRNMRRRGYNPAQIEQTLAAMRTKYPGLMHKIEPPDVEDSE